MGFHICNVGYVFGTPLSLLLGEYPFCFFFGFFFGVAQAFKRRFCSGIFYFSVFLLLILLRFWGSNMLQRGDYAREICYFVVVHASPLPLKPTCIICFFIIRAVSILLFFWRSTGV